MDTLTLLLIASTGLAGLMTGLMFAFSCSINPGLGVLGDSAYIKAMQSINKAILNPVFLTAFTAPLVLLPLTAYLHYQAGLNKPVLLIIAAPVYITGVFGVTVAGNVPLNESLAQINLNNYTVDDLAIARVKFQSAWNNFHLIRTFASAIAFLLLIVSCVTYK